MGNEIPILKPCPLCGGHARFISDLLQAETVWCEVTAYCERCELEISEEAQCQKTGLLYTMVDLAGAVAIKWNRRSGK